MIADSSGNPALYKVKILSVVKIHSTSKIALATNGRQDKTMTLQMEACKYSLARLLRYQRRKTGETIPSSLNVVATEFRRNANDDRKLAVFMITPHCSPYFAQNKLGSRL